MCEYKMMEKHLGACLITFGEMSFMIGCNRVTVPLNLEEIAK